MLSLLIIESRQGVNKVLWRGEEGKTDEMKRIYSKP